MDEPTRPLAFAEPKGASSVRGSSRIGWLIGVLVIGLLVVGLGTGWSVTELRRQNAELREVNAELAATQRTLSRGINRLARQWQADGAALAALQSNVDQISDAVRETDQEIRDQLPDWSAVAERVSRSVFRVICVTDEVITSGSGFAVRTDAAVSGTSIVTNEHVIDECRDGRGAISLRHGATSYDVVLTASSLSPDVAVLVTPERLRSLKVGETPSEADPVMAIGTPLGLADFENTKTFGRISKFDGGLIQFDASINRGNSGGPLIDRRGRVIGVNTYKGEGEGLGLAIRMRDVCTLVGC